MSEESKPLDDNGLKDIVKQFKTPEYKLRATRNYKNKKYAEDPEYKKKLLEKQKEWYYKNKDKYKVNRNIYMKEYYAKKKLEKQTNQQSIKEENTDEFLVINIDKLSITT